MILIYCYISLLLHTRGKIVGPSAPTPCIISPDRASVLFSSSFCLFFSRTRKSLMIKASIVIDDLLRVRSRLAVVVVVVLFAISRRNLKFATRQERVESPRRWRCHGNVMTSFNIVGVFPLSSFFFVIVVFPFFFVSFMLFFPFLVRVTLLFSLCDCFFVFFLYAYTCGS